MPAFRFNQTSIPAKEAGEALRLYGRKHDSLKCDLDPISFELDLEREFEIEWGDEEDLRMRTFQGTVEMVLEKTRKK